MSIPPKNTDKSVTSLQQAFRNNPDNASFWVMLGEMKKMSGRADLAIDDFRRALALSPGDAYIYLALAETKKFESIDDDVLDMERLLKRHDLTSEQKRKFGMALGKAYDDIGDHDKSFAHYQQANQEKRSSFNFNIDDERRRFAQLKRVFCASLFEQFEGAGYPISSPVFVVGMPRSGTTLVEALLASHPDVYGAGESATMFKTLDGLLRQTGRDNQASIEHIGDATREALYRAGHRYVDAMLETIRRDSDTRPNWFVDKVPHNFLHIGFIKLLLPNAKIVHCTRTAEATCFSLYKRLFAEEHLYSYDLVELGQYYRLYADLMEHWHSVLPGFVYDVSYEELVTNQRETLKNLFDFCQIPWDEACMRHSESKRFSNTNPIQVNQPVYASAVDYWRTYEKHLQPLSAILNGN